MRHTAPPLTWLRSLALLAAAAQAGIAHAADNFLNVDLVSETPVPGAAIPRHCGDLWAEGIYAYIGSDRAGGGIAIFDISDPENPDFITEYEGEEMEDVEVYNGIGYFGSDDNEATPATGTGVDIVDLSNPFNPVRISRINASIGGHYKVHTLSVNDGFLYTSDNITDTIKVFNVSNPASPQFVTTIDLSAVTPGGLPNGLGTHEVQARDGRLYVATKYTSASNTLEEGYTHIFDVSNIGTTGYKLFKSFNTGRKVHTSSVSPDGKTLVITQEWGQSSPPDSGDVRLYDISMINQENDPDQPVLLATINKPITDAWSPHHPHIHDDLMFVAWYEAGLQVYNIADPKNPRLVGAYDTYPGTSTNFNGNWGVYPYLGYDKILLSDRNRGLLIVDGTDIPRPTPDFNFDANVDGLDFLAWQQGFGTLSAGTPQIGDGNRDGKVDAADLAYWRANFGETGHQHAVPAVADVPEASTLSLALAAGILLRPRRRPRAMWRR